MGSPWRLVFVHGCEAQEHQEEDYDHVTLLAVRDVRAPAMHVAFFSVLSPLLRHA